MYRLLLPLVVVGLSLYVGVGNPVPCACVDMDGNANGNANGAYGPVERCWRATYAVPTHGAWDAAYSTHRLAKDSDVHEDVHGGMVYMVEGDAHSTCAYAADKNTDEEDVDIPAFQGTPTDISTNHDPECTVHCSILNVGDSDTHPVSHYREYLHGHQDRVPARECLVRWVLRARYRWEYHGYVREDVSLEQPDPRTWHCFLLLYTPSSSGGDDGVRALVNHDHG